MSWSDLPPELQTAAKTAMTAREFEAYRLWEDGLGYGRIALVLGISPSTVRDRIKRGIRKVEAALEIAA
jgi:DNA-binding CsgD family transcriptional regulator